MQRLSNFSKEFAFTSTANLFSTMLTFVLFNLLTACNPQGDLVTPQDATYVETTNSIKSTNQAINAQIDSNSTLKSVASFPIGAAFSSRIISKNPKAYQLFLNQFTSKTVHSYMNVEPVQGQFNFAEPDYWVEMAQKNPMRLHGHCLIYHLGAPDWILQYSGSIPSFESIIKNHIQTVVGRYKGKIKSWDVINEMFEYNSGKIRQTEFRQLYPSDAAYMAFVKRCFVWAHEADPNAQLFYSDFGLESYPAKVQAVINLVDDFKRSGTPINGISTHFHINLNTSEAGIISSLRQLSTTGLQVHISELDISLNPKNDQNLIFSEQLLNAQRAKYQLVATAYKLSVPPAQRFGITLWSFSDADSWLVTVKKLLDQPNIFDKNFNKKPAYYGLMTGLKS